MSKENKDKVSLFVTKRSDAINRLTQLEKYIADPKDIYVGNSQKGFFMLSQKEGLLEMIKSDRDAIKAQVEEMDKTLEFMARLV